MEIQKGRKESWSKIQGLVSLLEWVTGWILVSLSLSLQILVRHFVRILFFSPSNLLVSQIKWSSKCSKDSRIHFAVSLFSSSFSFSVPKFPSSRWIIFHPTWISFPWNLAPWLSFYFHPILDQVLSVHSCDQQQPHFEFKVLHRQTVCSFIYSIRILYTTCRKGEGREWSKIMFREAEGDGG